MKHHLKLALGSILLTPVFVVGTVLAQEQQQTTAEQPTTTETAPQQMTAEEKQKLLERVQQRKAEAKLKLTNTQQKRLQARCAASQGKVQSLVGRQKGVETSHAKVHANLVDRLTKLETKLAEQKVDTAALKTQIAELQAKIATFKTDFAAYQALATDVVNMDCVADPTAFKVSLEATRTALKKVHDDSVAIKAYVNETIKPTLQQIRAQLADEDSDTQPDDNDTSTTTNTEGQ